MRVLHVITSLVTAGAEHLLTDLLPCLRNIGVDVEVCVFNGTRFPFYEQMERNGFKIHVLSMKEDYYNPLLIPKLRRLMRGFDIVHTHNTACQLFAAIAKGIGVRDEVTGRCPKLVTTEHSTSTRRRNHRIFHPIDRWMYRAYDQIICISQPSEDSLRGYIGEGYPIKTILNGVDVGRFLDAVPTDLGLRDRRVMTMVAGFRYEKDQPTVIKALKHLPEDYHLVLVGDGEKRLELEALAAELGLTERVHLLGVRTDVPGILKASDVVVMSSHREGLSLSNVEGMASGNPFVASDVEGLREVTRGYGVLFPHGDSKALAEAVLRLTTDGEYRQEVVRRCQERARQFDIQTMAEKYAREYGRAMRK